MASYANKRYQNELNKRKKDASEVCLICFSDESKEEEDLGDSTEDFKREYRPQFLLKMNELKRKPKMRNIDLIDWVLDTAASSLYFPADFLKLLTDIIWLNETLRVGNNQTMKIICIGTLFLPNGKSLRVKCVENLSVVLIGTGKFGERLPGWTFCFDASKATACQRGTCSCEKSKPTIENEFEIGKKIRNQLYLT